MATIKFYDDIYSGLNNKHTSYRWYNLDDYTKIHVSWISRDCTNGLDKAEFSKCRYWLMEQLESEIIIREVNESIGFYVYFYFLSDEDLVKFKLSPWGEKCLEWKQDK